MNIEQLETEISKLGEPEKRQVLKRLVAELEMGSDSDVERAWLEEAQRRYDELKSGAATGIPAEEALSNARNRLKRVR